MKLSELIDALLIHTSERRGVDDDFDQVLRERYWLRTIEVLEEFFGSWEWPFRYGTSAVSLTAGSSSCSAPSDFLTTGTEGGLFVTARRQEIVFKPSHWLLQARRLDGDAAGLPDYYTVFGRDSSGIQKFEFERLADATYSIDVDYERRAPHIVDRAPAPLASAVTGAGLGIGVYKYAMTVTTADGESAIGLIVTVTTTGGNQKVTLSNLWVPPSWGRITTKTLYRTAVGGSTFKLLSAITDLSTLTLDDTTADGSLGATAPTGTSGLELIPDDYCRSVIMEGVIALDARDLGDLRSASEHDARYRRQLNRAKANSQQGRESTFRIGDQGLPRWGMH